MLIQELAYTDNADFDWVGGYNAAPPNFREITEEELARKTHFGRQVPLATISKQICGFEKQALCVELFIYSDGTGVGVSVNFWGEGYYDRPQPVGPLKHVRWFRFAKCDHEYDEIGVGRCLHKWVCRKCGFSQIVDSSD